MVIWTPPACPSDKSRGDATTSSRGAFGASYIVFPLQRHRPPFFGRAGSAVAISADQPEFTYPTRQFAFRLAFMEEAGMGDAATSGAGYIAWREAEEDWAMAVTGKNWRPWAHGEPR